MELAVSVVTLFPELVAAVGKEGVTGRAVDKGIIALQMFNPRDYAVDRHRTVDDRPYGGGPGMVMQPGPLVAAIDDAAAVSRNTTGYDPLVVYLSPQGRQLDHQLVVELGGHRNLLLVAGRYEGIDERVISTSIDLEVSIGDFVLSGGELAAMVVIDALARQVPGVLGHQNSAEQDSFAADGLLDCPHYTRPEVFAGQSVPAVLLSGDHAAIARWRRMQSLGRTKQKRPELLDKVKLTKEDQRLLELYFIEHGSTKPEKT
jgi:tRNA (guanine37-N1)-methyltransferase